MPKGSTVFAQIMSLIPRRQFNNCVARYNGDYRIRNFSCYDQFLVMSTAQYANKNSLRDIEASLTAISHKLYHSGISYAVPRNTLAKANELRDWHIYADLGQVLINKVRPLYSDDPFRLDLDNAVYAFDSSTISLCLKLCPWAKFRKTKAAIKMHTQLDLRGNIPVFIHLTDASVHDVRERWNVELFFKWIKQHLHIKSFYSTSENAVYTQIWIAVCSFLLIALAKKKWNLDQSLYTIPQTIGFVLFEEIPLNQLFNKSENLVPVDDYPNLFSFNES